MTVTATGFQTNTQDVSVRTPVPVEVNATLVVGTATTTVEVTAAADLVETVSTTHTDVDRDLFDKLPLESQSSSLSSLVTLASPGIAADSNGLFPWTGRSRFELVLDRRPADYRSAEQGLLEPDSRRRGAVHGSD